MILGRKADKNEFDNHIALKANKCDAELAFKWLDLLHKQLKQTLVLLIEILKQQLAPGEEPGVLAAPGEGANQSQNSKVYLFQQALLIGQWINKFNVNNVEEYFRESSAQAPPDVLAFQRFAEASLQEVDKMPLSPTNQFLNQNIRLKSRAAMLRGKVNNTAALC